VIKIARLSETIITQLQRKRTIVSANNRARFSPSQIESKIEAKPACIENPSQLRYTSRSVLKQSKQLQTTKLAY